MSAHIKRICVYCGSNSGANPAYHAAARRLGETLAERGIGLVYGGASVGLMGVVADAALARGGEVIGVLPEVLKRKEVAHPGLSALHIVGSMHERKALMAELSDAFIALPGGLGTLEELFEILTWALLGLHRKPCGLLNIEGYYDGLAAFLERAVSDGFVRRKHRELLLVEKSEEALLDGFACYRPLNTSKWIELNNT